jgi:capsular exopolysaccharide synthesis family protein
VVTAKKWVILGLVAVTMLVVMVAAPHPKVSYEATCFMAPTAQAMRGGASTAASSTQNQQEIPDRNVILSNLVLLAQSNDVFRRASEFLALPVEEQRAEAPGLPAYKRISRLTSSPGVLLETADWQDSLVVSPVFNPGIGKEGTISDIISIKVTLPNGEDAPFIANAVGVAFVNAYRQKNLEDNTKYASFLKAGADQARKKLEDTEAKVLRYKRAHKVAVPDVETQNAVTALSSAEAARDGAQAEADEARAALQEINQQLAQQPLVRAEVLPADMNPQVEKLKQDLSQAEADLSKASLQYKPGHSAYKALEARVQSLKDSIAKQGKSYSRPAINELHGELEKQRSAASNRLRSASAKLADLSAQVSQAQARVSDKTGAQSDLADLMREQQSATDQYTLFTQRLAQATIADQEFEKYGSIIPYDWASTASGPNTVGPRRRTLLILAFVLSLILGIAVVVFLDSIDNRLRSRYDAEKLLGLPIVGMIPAITGRDGQLPKLTHLFPLSPTAEAYRLLRTDVLFTQRDNPFKTLMVATGKPGQGATTTICNLAIALAQIGKRVILIDADMRRPKLHKFFGVPNDAGLSTLLKGKGNPMDCIRHTGIENLIVIPAGPTPLNASELLASERMSEIVKRLQEHFDLVLFDTPSTIVFSDGSALASWLDAVLFVVSANQVSTGSEKLALEMLRKAKANIIGAVVNRLSADTVDSARFYSHYYATENMELDIDSLPAAVGDGSDVVQIGGVSAKELLSGEVKNAMPAPSAETDGEGLFPE